ncbi:MAG: DUF3891 family protein [Gaiellaceae bacterium]
MIVRDRGDSWQVVLQTDHADLAGEFARDWVDPDGRDDSLVLAAERHDDGWAVWEQAPLVEPETGRPINFLDVGVPAHLAFYRACIAAVSEQDPYAGLLVSMHGAGIYRQRYGTDLALSLTRAAEVAEQVEEFVAEQEATHEGRLAASGRSDEQRWADYHRLQLYDRLSLYFCMRDVENGESWAIGDYRLSPLGAWRVAVDPYPFLDSPARFTLLRRILPKHPWTQSEFPAEFFALAPEHVEITIERA